MTLISGYNVLTVFWVLLSDCVPPGAVCGARRQAASRKNNKGLRMISREQSELKNKYRGIRCWYAREVDGSIHVFSRSTARDRWVKEVTGRRYRGGSDVVGYRKRDEVTYHAYS